MYSCETFSQLYLEAALVRERLLDKALVSCIEARTAARRLCVAEANIRSHSTDAAVVIWLDSLQ